MSRGSGHRLFKEIDFREDAPPTGNAPVGSTRPSPDRQAHSFTKDDVVEHIASNFDGDDLAAFEAVIMRMRG